MHGATSTLLTVDNPDFELRNVGELAISPIAIGVPRQLFTNQLWETVAFLAKAGFLVLLTPLMLRAWGSEGYGQFALASSAFVLLAALDCGIRPQLRLALCEAVNAEDTRQYRFLVCRALVSFGVVAMAVSLFVLLAILGFGSSITSHPSLSLTTVGMTLLVLFSGLLVEPLAAHGQLGSFKCAQAAGSACAIPSAYLALRTGGGPAVVVAAWLGSLAIANFVLFAFSRVRADRIWSEFSRVRFADVRATLQEGFWFGAINLSWLAKTHGLTFVVSLFSGAAAAGPFFILLRTSEVIGTLCAVSSDASIAVLARARDRAARLNAFSHAYRYALILSSHVAVGVLLLGPVGLRLWLGDAAVFGGSALAGVAAFGIASAFNRIIMSAAVGLNLVRPATVWASIETMLTLLGAAIAEMFFGSNVALFLAALAVGSLVPVASLVADRLHERGTRVWLQPMLPCAAIVLFGSLAAPFGRIHGGTYFLCGATALVSASAIWQILRVHSTGTGDRAQRRCATREEAPLLSSEIRPCPTRTRPGHPG